MPFTKFVKTWRVDELLSLVRGTWLEVSRTPEPCDDGSVLKLLRLREKSTCSALLMSWRKTSRVLPVACQSRRPMKLVSGVLSWSTPPLPALNLYVESEILMTE